MGAFIKQRAPVEGENTLGLQNYGFVMWPDAESEFEIPFIQNRYKLGTSNETKFGLTKKQLEKFEGYFGVTFDSEEGQEWLSKYTFKISHLAQPFDESDTEVEFVGSILRANDGMGFVNMGKDSDILYPFVLKDETKELEEQVSRKYVRNEAIAKLQSLQTSDKKLIRIAKYLFNLNSNLTKDQAYNQLNDYLYDKFANSEIFLKALNVDEEWLDTVVTVKDALNAGIIRMGEDQVYVNFANGAKLGRTLEEISKYLSNPNNQDQLGTGGSKDQPYSIKYQLKNKIN